MHKKANLELGKREVFAFNLHYGFFNLLRVFLLFSILFNVFGGLKRFFLNEYLMKYLFSRDIVLEKSLNFQFCVCGYRLFEFFNFFWSFFLSLNKKLWIFLYWKISRTISSVGKSLKFYARSPWEPENFFFVRLTTWVVIGILFLPFSKGSWRNHENDLQTRMIWVNVLDFKRQVNEILENNWFSNFRIN